MIGRFATLDSSSVTWPEKPGVDEAGGRVGEQAEAAQRRLALEPAGDVVGQRDDLVRRAEHELARVQDERLVAVRLDQAGEVGLLGARVDVRVAVVLEDAEAAVEPHVDARRLDHRLVVGLDARPGPRRVSALMSRSQSSTGRGYRLAVGCAASVWSCERRG